MLRLRQRSRRGRIRTRGEGNDRAPLRAPQAIPQSGALRLAQDGCGKMGWAQIWSNFCGGCSRRILISVGVAIAEGCWR